MKFQCWKIKSLFHLYRVELAKTSQLSIYRTYLTCCFCTYLDGLGWPFEVSVLYIFCVSYGSKVHWRWVWISQPWQRPSDLADKIARWSLVRGLVICWTFLHSWSFEHRLDFVSGLRAALMLMMPTVKNKKYIELNWACKLGFEIQRCHFALCSEEVYLAS